MAVVLAYLGHHSNRPRQCRIRELDLVTQRRDDRLEHVDVAVLGDRTQTKDANRRAVGQQLPIPRRAKRCVGYPRKATQASRTQGQLDAADQQRVLVKRGRRNKLWERLIEGEIGT